MTDFLSTLPLGNHLVFTHGGPITTVLYDKGVESMPTPGSLLGVTLSDGKIASLDLNWEFPVVEEDL